MEKKAFFVTVDTEGDSLWGHSGDNRISTENVLWIPRFQYVCEKYGFKPIWLTDYEIIMDDRYVDFIKERNDKGLCEVGMHVHARNNPPLYQLKEAKESNGAYLIEYPKEIMNKKFVILKKTIEERLGCEVYSHRAGRWALDENYIQLLEDEGIKYDCSVTPGIDWSRYKGFSEGSQGSDYSQYANFSQKIGVNKIVKEYPVSILPCKRWIAPAKTNTRTILKSSYHYLNRSQLWLRPNNDNNLNEMKYIIDTIKRENGEYAEFMIHSSELMPGGSPNFSTKKAIEEMYVIIEKLFDYARNSGFEGYTFKTWEERR